MAPFRLRDGDDVRLRALSAEDHDVVAHPPQLAMQQVHDQLGPAVAAGRQRIPGGRDDPNAKPVARPAHLLLGTGPGRIIPAGGAVRLTEKLIVAPARSSPPLKCRFAESPAVELSR